MASVSFEEEAADPAQLASYLWLGSQDAAENQEALDNRGIKHIANVADDVECAHGPPYVYLHCRLIDNGADENIVTAFQTVTDFVREARDQGGAVLIHCLMGMNRSATVAMAVLMNLEGWSLRAAWEHTKKCRSAVSPFPGNRKFLSKWERDTRGTSTMPEWLPADDDDWYVS